MNRLIDWETHRQEARSETTLNQDAFGIDDIQARYCNNWIPGSSIQYAEIIHKSITRGKGALGNDNFTRKEVGINQEFSKGP